MAEIKKINTDLQIEARLLDGNGSAGTSGQILSSTGMTTDWISLSEISGVDGTGTTNYVAKWSDTDTITNSVIYDDGTNVGIGTASPSHKLDVRGSGYFLGDTSVPNAPTDLGFYLGKSQTDENRRLEIVSPANGVSYIDFTKPGTDYRGRIAYYDNGDSFRFYTASAEKLRIDSSGNVGIGTGSPQSKLHVAKNGNANGGSILMGMDGSGTSKWSFLAGAHYDQATGSGNGSGSAGVAVIGALSTATQNKVYIGGGPYEINPATQIEFWTYPTTTYNLGGTLRGYVDNGGNWFLGNTLWIDDADDYVGIGTTNPESILHISDDWDGSSNGQLTISGKSNFQKRLRLGFNTTTNVGTIQATWVGTGNQILALNPGGGNVGIGTDTPGEKLTVDGNISATGTITGSNLSGTNTGDQDLSGYALTSHNHDDIYYTESESDSRFVNVTGDTMSGSLNVNADIQANTFTQAASGIPRNNLGAPTVTEMALFDSQFTPKTTLANNYDDLTDLTFWVQDTSSSAWTEITTYSDDQKRRFLRTNNSSVVIPNGAYKFRVEFVGKDYTFANAMYAYWSSNSHSTQVHIWKYNVNSSSWIQHTNSSTIVSSWPGHLYLPFSTIPWLETATTHTGHFKSIRVEFTPNWSTGSYSNTDINLSGMQIWGGYPSGRRTPHYYDQNGKLNTWGDFDVNGTAIIDGNVGIGTNTPGYTLDVNGSLRSTSLTIADAIYHEGDTNTYIQFPTNDAIRWVTNGGERMRLDSAGGLGIGTSTITSNRRLDVNGNALIRDNIYIGATGGSNSAYSLEIGQNRSGNGFAFIDLSGDATYGGDFSLRIIRGNTGANATSQIIHRGTGNFSIDTLENADIILNPGSGDVGIGTTNPTNKLSVQDSITGPVGPSNLATIYGYNTSTDTTYANSVGVAGRTLTTQGKAIYGWAENGGWGGYFNGKGFFDNTVTATNFILSSDKTLKDNISDIKTDHIDVSWKNFELKSEPGVKRAGVIAQELEEKHPEFVRTDNEGIKSVAYIDLLIAKIAELEARLEKAGL